MEIINLSEGVLAALRFFKKNPPKPINLKRLRLPIVIGSGNAYNAGRVIFASQPAIFADESNLKETLKNYQPLIKNKIISEALVISASGSKDSVWELQAAKKAGLKTRLFTCTSDSPAAAVADTVHVFRKIAEPYTYNISTYLGMVLATSQENPAVILNYLKKLDLPDFKKYSAFAFILPDGCDALNGMFEIKRDELFGPHLALRAFTAGHARHAKFVNPWNKELIVSLIPDADYFGFKDQRYYPALPEKYGPAFLLSLGYYLIGRIQAAKPQYFQKNIAAYCRDYGPKAYGKDKPFDVIVPGN
jgi:hypothetical protein